MILFIHSRCFRLLWNADIALLMSENMRVTQEFKFYFKGPK
jgi:hypothetical protein